MASSDLYNIIKNYKHNKELYGNGNFISDELKTKIVETAIKNMSENISKEMGKAHHDHLIAQATEDFQKI